MDEPLTLRDARSVPQRKGEKTRDAILNDSVALASQVGLEGLSIGGLATRTGMSKSGLFAHFGSKEELQRATLARAEQLFQERVFLPTMLFPPGLGRLRALAENWIRYLDGCEASPGGCLLITASIEYDDRPGTVRTILADGQRALRGAIAKSVRVAVEANELRSTVDPWQFTFELYGIVLAAYHERRLLDDRRSTERAMRAFDRLVQSYAAG